MPPVRCARRKRGRPAAAARAQAALSGVEGARAASEAAETTETFSRIVAPFDGVVTEKMVEPGNMAAPGTPLMRVEDTRGFRLDVRVDESRIGQIAPGAIVPIALDAGTGWRAASGPRHGDRGGSRGGRGRAGVSRQDRAARGQRVALGDVRPGTLQRRSLGVQ